MINLRPHLQDLEDLDMDLFVTVTITFVPTNFLSYDSSYNNLENITITHWIHAISSRSNGSRSTDARTCEIDNTNTWRDTDQVTGDAGVSFAGRHHAISACESRNAIHWSPIVTRDWP